MKLFTYMMKKFISIFLGALIFFILILELVNLFQNLWNYINRGVTLPVIFELIKLYMPRCAWYAVPMSMLFATSYMLSDLYAKNELVAIFASGVSLFKFTFPLLVLAFFMSIGLFLFEDNVVVQSEAKFKTLQNEVLHKDQSLSNEDVVIISQNGEVIYNSTYYDDELHRLYNLFIVFRNEDKELDCVIYADSAFWNEHKWVLSNSRMYKNINDEYRVVPVSEEYTNRLTENPSSFQNNLINVSEVSSKEAKVYIEHLERSGLPTAEPKSEYYKKFAFPFVCFIVVFLAIGLSGKTRKNVLVISLSLSILSVVLFYVTQMVTMLMAKFGNIPPVMGEWVPVILFTFLSSILLKYART